MQNFSLFKWSYYTLRLSLQQCQSSQCLPLLFVENKSMLFGLNLCGSCSQLLDFSERGKMSFSGFLWNILLLPQQKIFIKLHQNRTRDEIHRERISLCVSVSENSPSKVCIEECQCITVNEYIICQTSNMKMNTEANFHFPLGLPSLNVSK